MKKKGDLNSPSNAIVDTVVPLAQVNNETILELTRK